MTTLDRLAQMPQGRTYDLTVCLTCPDAPCFESEEFSDHVAQAHGVPHETPMTCHMALIYDSYDFYGVAYAWRGGTVEAEQFIQTPRPAESQPYYRLEAAR